MTSSVWVSFAKEGFVFARILISPGIDVTSDADIDAFVRAKSETCYHPSSTCKMGMDEYSVLDPMLRVRGVEGLRVVDASVMPTTVGGNLNAPVIMIAEKASDLILGQPALSAETVPVGAPDPGREARAL